MILVYFCDFSDFGDFDDFGRFWWFWPILVILVFFSGFFGGGTNAHFWHKDADLRGAAHPPPIISEFWRFASNRNKFTWVPGYLWAGIQLALHKVWFRYIRGVGSPWRTCLRSSRLGGNLISFKITPGRQPHGLEATRWTNLSFRVWSRDWLVDYPALLDLLLFFLRICKSSMYLPLISRMVKV